jgi:hypothetical protein
LPVGRSLRPAETVRVTRAQPGLLAAALSTRRAPEEIQPINTTVSPSNGETPVTTQNSEVHRMQLRKKALRRAQLRANFQALGTLGAMGFLFAAILGIGALALGFRPFWAHAATSTSIQDVTNLTRK